MYAIRSYYENCQRNQCGFIRVIRGSSDVIPNEQFHVILANINRNILIEQMPDYARHSKGGAKLLLSGLMVQDKELVREAAEREGFVFETEQLQDQWALLVFNRN